MRRHRCWTLIPALALLAAAGCAPADEPEPRGHALPLPAPDALPESPEDVRPLLAGMPMPALDLPLADGSRLTLHPDSLTRPVVLTFYRGGWCPYCNRHLSAMRDAEAQLREWGFDIVFLSADAPEVLLPSLDEPVGYLLASDQDLAAARAFGIAFRVDDATVERYLGVGIDLEAASGRDHLGLPVPATFLVGTDGVLRLAYANPNYRVRLAPSVLLAAAQAYLDESG